MSYCVNCGVELDQSAKKCALCSTPVINPNITKAPAEDKPFSENLQIPESMKKRFIAFFVSVALLIPNIVMFFLNVFFIRDGFWSLYVMSACALVWVIFILPFFIKKKPPLLLWGFDTVAVTAFAYIVLFLQGCSAGTIKSVVFVLVLSALAVGLLLFWLMRRKRHWTSVTAFLLAEAFAVSMLSGIMVSFFSGIYNFFVVGVVISVCAAVLMIFFIYCSRSKLIRAWLNKVFYI